MSSRPSSQAKAVKPAASKKKPEKTQFVLEDITRGSLSKETVERLQAALTRHYGERVAPVSEYCNGFRQWMKALRQRADELEASGEEDTSPDLTAIARLPGIELAISKSNLLWRLIYEGQPLREVKCPVHNGRWSGCVWEPARWCECMDGSDITGWLPDHRLHTSELINRYLKAQGKPGGQYQTSMPGFAADPERPHTAAGGGHVCYGASMDEACEALAEALAAEGFVSEEWQPQSSQSSA